MAYFLCFEELISEILFTIKTMKSIFITQARLEHKPNLNDKMHKEEGQNKRVYPGYMTRISM